VTIFSWNFNQVKTDNEALDWEPQFAPDIDVDQVLLDENITVSTMRLQPLRNRNRLPKWAHQLNSSRPSMVITLDDQEGELH